MLAVTFYAKSELVPKQYRAQKESSLAELSGPALVLAAGAFLTPFIRDSR